jgi:methionyl-tRNA formyltransferase
MTTQATLDLFVGSTVGLNYAATVPGEQIGRVYVADEDSLAEVRRMGHDAHIYPCAVETPARLCFSVHFPRVLPTRVLELYEGCYNLHPGFLPHGKGMFPLFWAIWAGEPAGVSLHVMSPVLDGGPILRQIPVEVGESETMEALRVRLSAVEEGILAEVTPKLLSGERLEDSYPSIDQSSLSEDGTIHTRRDFEKMRDEPPLTSMSANDLIRLMRALHLTGFPGVKTEIDGVPARLQIIPDPPES